jgi:hypothetical protein
VEVAGAPSPVAESGATEAVVSGEGISPPHPVVAEAEGVETLALDEQTNIVQESAVPEMMTRATSPRFRRPRRQRCPCHKA